MVWPQARLREMCCPGHMILCCRCLDSSLKIVVFIYQPDQNIAINRAFVSKWGVEIGSVTLVFLRGQTAAQMPEMNLAKW